MTPEQQRAPLIELLERLQDRAITLEAELNGIVHARLSASDDDEHDPEGETLSSQWSMRAGLLESARAEVKQAEEALQRLDAGSYGICTACLKPIPPGQLEVRPFRELCVACAS